MSAHYVVLTGGTGGAKFVAGLAAVVPHSAITCIVNTGDDLDWWGLRVCPDIDSIAYTLSGRLSRERGWGVEGDTFQCRDTMKQYGAPAWFSVGDKDLAVHLLRTEQLRQGRSLTAVTAEIAARMGAQARILPMSDDRVETRVVMPEGELAFEEYFVGRRCQIKVDSVHFRGAGQSTPAPGVVEAIASADAVFLAPSNPVTSIGPILSVPGMVEALSKTPAPVIAISPIVAGAAVSGPAGALMAAQGLPVSLMGVVQAYAGFLNALIADHRDASEAAAIDRSDLQVHCTQTIMKTDEDRIRLANTVLEIAMRMGMKMASEPKLARGLLSTPGAIGELSRPQP